ncbi:MAG: AGE family epimerase/isomerase [Breznakibacter sp.]
MTDTSNMVSGMTKELDQILRYWQTKMVDNEFGGFHGQRNHFDTLVPQASKGCVLNARILWTFLAAYRFTQNAGYLQTATRAYDYLVKYFWDKQHGGLFWELDHTGAHLNTRKQIYAQGFGIYGLSEYYRATGNTFALNKAIELFRLVEQHSYDPGNGGYIEALARDWSPLEDMRLSPKDANEPKSMNTHLHILEPYTSLLRIWPDDGLKQKIASLIHVFLHKIVDGKTAHFNLFFGMDWEVRSKIVSYGHDIEGAWLLSEAAHVLGYEPLVTEVEATAKRMVDAVMAEGTDTDGAVFYEKNLARDHLDTDKHWWPQAETMVGLAWMWRQTGNDVYLQRMAKTWDFIQHHLIDKEHGEWFWRVGEQNRPITSEDKAGFWKCPYHNSRALMEVMEVLRREGC